MKQAGFFFTESISSEREHAHWSKGNPGTPRSIQKFQAEPERRSGKFLYSTTYVVNFQYANLDRMMKKYAYWGHLMFPKMKTEDVLSRVETLGTRRQVKVSLMKHRMGMDGYDEVVKETRKLKSNDDIIDDGAEDEPTDYPEDTNSDSESNKNFI